MINDRYNIGKHCRLLVIFTVAMMLCFSLSVAHAAVDCSAAGAADYDSDGFSDELECAGIFLVDGRTLVTNPEQKDLFVFLIPAAGGNMPADPLGYISAPTSDGGLGITVHEIDPSYDTAERLVSALSTQKAVRITESLDTASMDILGYANYGTPNGLDNAIIYTQRIINFIDGKCTGKSVCQDSDGSSGSALKDKYIKHTIAHEAGHMMNLTTSYNSRFGGYHYKTGTKVILDQSVYYTDKGGKVTWYIGSPYTSADQSGVKLK